MEGGKKKKRTISRSPSTGRKPGMLNGSHMLRVYADVTYIGDRGAMRGAEGRRIRSVSNLEGVRLRLGAIANVARDATVSVSSAATFCSILPVSAVWSM